MQALNVKHDLGESLPTEFVLERNEYQNGYKHTASVSKDFFIPSWWPIARCAHFEHRILIKLTCLGILKKG